MTTLATSTRVAALPRWRGIWMAATVLWGSLTFQVQNTPPEGNDSGDGSSGSGSGCSSGWSLAGAGAILAKVGTVLKGGVAVKTATVAGGSALGGRAGLKAAGTDFLRSSDKATLLRDTALLDDVPELRQALTSGQSIETFLAENPDAAISVGIHLARRDPQAFARHLVDDIANPARPRLVHVDDEQARKVLRPHADSIARDLEGVLASDARPIDYELLLQKARIAAKNHSMDGAEVSVVNDGLFLEIKVAQGSHELTARIDLASLSATGLAGAITYDLRTREGRGRGRFQES